MEGKRRRLLPWMIVPLATLPWASCTLDDETVATIDYDSKVVEYMLPVGVEGAYETVISKVFNSAGALVGKFVLSYDESGVNTHTDVYEYDTTSGAESYLEYYDYTYETVGDVIRIAKGETYATDGTLELYYEVAYDVDFPDAYTQIDDYEMSEGTAVPTARQVSTYLKDTNLASYGQYRTEQYLSWDGDSWVLKSEYACWYDDEGNYAAELYHVIRGSTTDPVLPDNTADDAYFYVPYARNTEGYVYLQADRLYLDTADGIPSALRQANGAFVVDTTIASGAGAADPFGYSILSSATGTQVGMLLMEFDDMDPPNTVREMRYLYGDVQDVTIYNYDAAGALLDEATYVRGGEVLDAKTAYRYSDDTIGETTYQVCTTYMYSYSYDIESGESKALDQARAHYKAARVYDRSGSCTRVGSNHARQDG